MEQVFLARIIHKHYFLFGGVFLTETFLLYQWLLAQFDLMIYSDQYLLEKYVSARCRDAVRFPLKISHFHFALVTLLLIHFCPSMYMIEIWLCENQCISCDNTSLVNDTFLVYTHGLAIEQKILNGNLK